MRIFWGLLNSYIKLENFSLLVIINIIKNLVFIGISEIIFLEVINF